MRPTVTRGADIPSLAAPALTWSRERQQPGHLPPAPPFLDPPGDRLRVGPGRAAQVRGLLGQRLVQLPRTEALEDSSDLGEQVGPAVGEFTQSGYCRGFLGFAKRSPPGPLLRLSGEHGDEQPVSLRTFFDHMF